MKNATTIIIRLSIISLICFSISGCTYNRGMIHDYELHESGKPKKASDVYFYGENDRFTHSSEYYENGRLKSEEWSELDRPLHRIEFYESGRIKSEERYINGKLDYAAYYKEDGQVRQTTGQLIDWVTRKSLRKQ